MPKSPTAKAMLDLVKRQSSASHALTDCTTFRDMAGAIAQHMLVESGQFIALNMVEETEDSTNRRLLTLATANRQESYNSVEVIEITTADMGSLFSDATPVVIENVQGYETISPTFRDWLLNNKIQALAAWPMRHGEHLLGVLCLSSITGDLNVSEVVLQIYQVLADQVGSLIAANHLIADSNPSPKSSDQPETESAQEFSAQLAQTNREIAAAENYEALANILMGVMPETVTALAVALFDRPVQADERPSTLESKVIVSRTGATDLQVVDQIAPHPDLANTLQRLSAGEVVVLSKTANPILPPITLSLLQAQGLSSISLIGLRIGSRLSGLLMLGSERELSLSKFLEGNYRSLADQVAISIENRGLLGQTAETLSFVQTQFEATSAVYDSENPQEMLQAFYRFTGGQFKDAHLGLIDRDNAPNIVRIMAQAHDDQISTNVSEMALETYPAYESLPALETLYVPDVANDAFLSEAERSRLHTQDIGGLVIVPMVVNQQLTGLIAFMSPVPTTVSPNRLRALRNLADQAAVAFENQTLLASTAATLDETRLLYDVNRSILASQDTLDVLRVIRQLIAAEAGSINHMTVVYDANGLTQDVRIDFISLLNGAEQVNDLSLAAAIGPEKIAAFQPFWQAHPDTVYFVEDMDAVALDYPLAQYALDNGDYSTISILIRENNQVAELVNVTYAQPQKFATHQRRLYEAISDQVAIVFQNHRLLRESQISAAQLSKQVQKLQRINQFGTMINAASDEKSLLDSATELVVKLVEVDHSGIVLFNPGDEFGVVVSEYPLHGSLGAKIPTVNNPLWDELQVKGEFRPIVVSDVKSDSRVEPLTRKAFDDLGLHSIAILPIVVHNQLIGGVGLDIYSPNRSVTEEMIENAQIVTAQINLAVQNVRLVRDIQASADQLKNQVQVLQTLNQLASQISVTLDEKELTDNTVRLLPELLKVDHCGIILFDAEKVSGTVVSEYPLTGALGNKIDVTTNSLYNYAHTRDTQPVVVNVDDDPRLGESTRELLRKIGTKTLVIIPLVISGEVIGTLGIDLYTDDQLFTPQLIETAQTVATQLAIGLQNIRLLSDTRHRAEQLQRIASFSQSVQATFDPLIIFDTLLTESANMLPIDQIAIMRYDPQSQELRTVAERVDTMNHIQLAGGDLVPISGPIAQVWSTREPLHIPDLRKVTQNISPSLTVRSWMVAPILSRGRVTGLVSAGCNRPYVYGEADIALFAQLINQLAVAIENAETYQQNQRIAKSESLVNDISTQLQRQTDIRSMLDITANELGKVLGARRARIRLATHIPDNGEAE